MKVGDKLYCIKNRFLYNDRCNLLVNKAGHEYVILEISHNTITLDSEEHSNQYFYSLEDDDLHYYYEDYFITIIEARKLKLKKINERRR
jgi:hypothetical protein